MCNTTKIISQVKSGKLSFCTNCKIYSLTFNNVFFQFELNELIQFKKYITKVDVEYWLNYYENTTQKRKIPVQTYHQNLILVFSFDEFEDLKILLKIKPNLKNEILDAQEIDYTFILN
jgi:hypothetical protein